MQLDYALEGYWLSKKRVFSVHTIKEYEITFRRFKEFLGTKQDLSKITAQDVERFLNHLRDDRNLCLKSVLNSWIALSSCWLNGILWILGTGAPGRDLPERYGPWQTIATRFYRWRKTGIWDRLDAAVQERDDGEGRINWDVQFVDGTIVRAHQHAAGA